MYDDISGILYQKGRDRKNAIVKRYLRSIVGEGSTDKVTKSFSTR